MDELSELLISKVHNHPFLYDDHHKEYKNLSAKEQAWKKIGDELKMSPMKVKSRWKNLRDSYVKYKNQLNKVTDAASQEAVNNRFIKWTGRAYLSFLDETLARRSQSSTQVPLKSENQTVTPTSKRERSLPDNKIAKESKKQKLNASRLKRKSQSKQRKSLKSHTSPKRHTEKAYKNEMQQTVNDAILNVFTNEIAPSENCLEMSTTNGIAARDTNFPVPSIQIKSNDSEFILNSLEDKRKYQSVLAGGGGDGGGGDAIDHLFSSYAQTFRSLPLRQQVNIKVEMAKLFAIAEIESQQ